MINFQNGNKRSNLFGLILNLQVDEHLQRWNIAYIFPVGMSIDVIHNSVGVTKLNKLSIGGVVITAGDIHRNTIGVQTEPANKHRELPVLHAGKQSSDEPTLLKLFLIKLRGKLAHFLNYFVGGFPSNVEKPVRFVSKTAAGITSFNCKFLQVKGHTSNLFTGADDGKCAIRQNINFTHLDGGQVLRPRARETIGGQQYFLVFNGGHNRRSETRMSEEKQCYDNPQYMR